MTSIDPLSMLEISFLEGEALIDVGPSNDSNIIESDPLEIGTSGLVETNDPLARTVAPVGKATILPTKATQEKLIENAFKLSQISQLEQFYRHSLYKTLNIILKKRLHCTICDVHIGCSLDVHDTRIIHPLLRVLICKKCSIEYNKADFRIGFNGSDTLCRWCGTDGRWKDDKQSISGLRFCPTCPYAFCERCIFRNLPLNEATPNWQCFVCKMSELWPLRAMCWALVSLLNSLASRKESNPVWACDISECCRRSKKNGINKVENQEKPAKLKKMATESSRNNSEEKVVESTRNHTEIIKDVVSPKANNGNLPLIDTLWLKSKVTCVSANLKVIDEKLNALSDTLHPNDTEWNISNVMDSLMRILSILKKQSEEYAKHLKSDWISMKPSTSPSEGTQTRNVTTTEERSLVLPQASPSTAIETRSTESKVETRAKTRPSLSITKVPFSPNRDENKILKKSKNKEFLLKNCFVKLERITELGK